MVEELIIVATGFRPRFRGRVDNEIQSGNALIHQFFEGRQSVSGFADATHLFNDLLHFQQ